MRAVLITLAVLVLLPFLLGFLFSLGYQWLRFSFARVRDCPHCGHKSLCFVEGMRPLVGGKVDAESMVRGYYECRRCSAHYRRSGRGPFVAVDADEWEQVLETNQKYRNAGF